MHATSRRTPGGRRRREDGARRGGAERRRAQRRDGGLVQELLLLLLMVVVVVMVLLLGEARWGGRWRAVRAMVGPGRSDGAGRRVGPVRVAGATWGRAMCVCVVVVVRKRGRIISGWFVLLCIYGLQGLVRRIDNFNHHHHLPWERVLRVLLGRPRPALALPVQGRVARHAALPLRPSRRRVRLLSAALA